MRKCRKVTLNHWMKAPEIDLVSRNHENLLAFRHHFQNAVLRNLQQVILYVFSYCLYIILFTKAMFFDVENNNCSIPLNGSDFDPGAVEMVNGSRPDGAQCARFKSHSKDKDKDKRK